MQAYQVFQAQTVKYQLGKKVSLMKISLGPPGLNGPPGLPGNNGMYNL